MSLKYNEIYKLQHKIIIDYKDKPNEFYKIKLKITNYIMLQNEVYNIKLNIIKINLIIINIIKIK